MAITTIDGLVAGFQPGRFFYKAATPTLVAGRPVSLWALNGIPGAGAYDTTLNGVTLSSASTPVNGQLPFPNPGGANSCYLARFTGAATIQGKLMLVDRLWHNGGYTITSTGAQSITSPTWPARDINGSTNGDGVLLGVEVASTTGAATPNVTISYTNSAGTSGRSANNIITTGSSSPNGHFYPIALQTGDTGVRSVQSLTLSNSWVSGSIALVAYRIIASIDLAVAFTPGVIDPITGGLPVCYAGTVPSLIFQPITTTASNINGMVTFAHG